MLERKEPIRKARFSINLPHFIKMNQISGPITLYLYLSMGENRKGLNPQSGSDFASFIELINRARESSSTVAISSLKIVLSGEGLYECYVGKEAATKLDKNWRETNIPTICARLNAEFKFDEKRDVLGWEQMVAMCPLYSEALKDTELLYKKNDEFRILVDGFAAIHKSKCKIFPADSSKIAAAKEYLFRESAMFLTAHNIVCYPSPRFNEAVCCALKILASKYQQSSSFYLGYEFTEPKEKPASAPISIKMDNIPKKQSSATHFLGIPDSQSQTDSIMSSSHNFFQDPEKHKHYCHLWLESLREECRFAQKQAKIREEMLQLAEEQYSEISDSSGSSPESTSSFAECKK